MTYLIWAATDNSDGSEGFSQFGKSSALSNVHSIHWKIHEHNLDCAWAENDIPLAILFIK